MTSEAVLLWTAGHRWDLTAHRLLRNAGRSTTTALQESRQSLDYDLREPEAQGRHSKQMAEKVGEASELWEIERHWPASTHLGNELITYAAYCAEVDRILRVPFEFLPELPDVAI
jgi:hypothetical protein